MSVPRILQGVVSNVIEAQEGNDLMNKLMDRIQKSFEVLFSK